MPGTIDPDQLERWSVPTRNGQTKQVETALAKKKSRMGTIASVHSRAPKASEPTPFAPETEWFFRGSTVGTLGQL
jgi:hypothetical protein